MKVKHIFLAVAVLLVCLLAFTSCDQLLDFIPGQQCEHTWEDATCTSPKTCSACGETEGEALGHTEETVEGKDATCTAAGFTEGKICTVCNEVTVAQTEIPAKGHTEGEAATCTTNQICTVCKVELKPATGHTLGPEATCDADQQCTVCETVLVSAQGHVPGNEATCTTNQICEVCKTELAPALGHTPGDEATCETAQTCTVCTAELAPKKGHDYVSSYEWSSDNLTCTVTATCKNDASHSNTETATVSEILLSVSAGKVTYTYTVKFAGFSLGEQSKTVDGSVEIVNGVATVYAPAVANKVASHDFVKIGLPNGNETKTFTFYYSEVDIWDGTSVSTSLEGEGTEENPFLIQSGADLAYLKSIVDAATAYTENPCSGQYFKMTKSIDLNGADFMIGYHTAWNSYDGFAGIFDGNNCSIRGLGIERTSESTGLFACVKKGAVVKNLSVYGNVTGKATVGAVAAYVLGTVDNVTSYVTITQTGAGTGTGTAGMIANAESGSSVVSGCVNYGDVTGESYILGGITGSGGHNITDCVNWGNVTAGNVSVGGIAGTTKDSGTISGCVNYGKITSTSTQYGQIGGIAGTGKKPVDNCVNYGEISGVVEVGGICGSSTKEITNCVNNGEVIIKNCTKTSIDGICSSNVTKTNCTNNGALTVSHTLTRVDEKAPACEVAGNIEYDNCSACGKNFDADGKLLESVEIPALDHKYNAVVTDPTCDADGFTTYTCELCGDRYTADPVNGGHKDENGDLKCDGCDANLCVDHVEAEAVKEKEVKATCESTGSYEEVVKCSKCGFEISRTPVEVPALGHRMDNGTVDGTVKTYACENGCGKTEVKYLVTVNYLFLDGSVAADADVIEYENDAIYTLNAKTVTGYVASHDYVKGHILSEGAVINIYYSEVSVWDGTSVSTSLSGSGTQADPYLIQSAADFAYFAGVINAVEGAAGTNYKVTTFKGQYFKMTKSIDLNGNSLVVGMHAAWNNYQGFFGHFDGNNCSIRGLAIDNSKAATSAALFGCINAGSLKNLSVYGSVKGNATTGGIVAYSVTNAVLENLTSYIEVNSVTSGSRKGTVGGIVANQESSAGGVINCVNYGTVTCDSYIVGGITGSGGAAITNCKNFGAVTSTASDVVGGITGSTKNSDSITSCYNYGTVKGNAYLGGIAGSIFKPITDCANYGDINGVYGMGGIAGHVETDKSTTITNCVNYGNVNGSTTSNGGILGQAETNAKEVTITGCTNYGKVTASWGGGGIAGQTIGTISNCENYGEIAGAGQLGGIAGKTWGTVKGCTNYGTVNATADICGGIVGNLYTAANEATIKAENTNNGTLTCPGVKGDIIGKIG